MTIMQGDTRCHALPSQCLSQCPARATPAANPPHATIPSLSAVASLVVPRLPLSHEGFDSGPRHGIQELYLPRELRSTEYGLPCSLVLGAFPHPSIANKYQHDQLYILARLERK